jgi:membrane protein required for colicin V production
MLTRHYAIDEKILPYAAFGAVFLIVVVLVSLLGKLLKSSIDKTTLGNADQVLGGGLGIIRTAFMASVVLWIIHSVNAEYTNQWSENSWLYPMVAKFAPATTKWIGEMFPVFSELFN